MLRLARLPLSILASCLSLTVLLVDPARAQPRVEVEVEVPVPRVAPPAVPTVTAEVDSAPLVIVEGDASAATTASARTERPALPALPPIDLPFRLTVEALLGFTNMQPAVDGSTFGLGIALEAAPLPWLALGLRGGWSIRPDYGVDLDRDGRADLNEGPINLLTLTGGPRFRIPTAPRGLDAFVLELGAGYAHVVDGRRPSGAVLEVALGRWGDSGMDLGGGPVLRWQQGLGDAGSLTTVLVGVQGGLELNGHSHSEGQSDLRYTLGFDASFGGGFLEQGLVSHGFVSQLGMTFGLPLADVIEPRVRVDFGHRVAGADRDGLETYGMSAGLRLLLDPWAPLYLEAAGGWALRFGTRAPEVTGGAFLDVGAGARFIGCDDSVAVVLGVRGRIGLADADALTAIYGTLGVEYDAVPPRQRPRCMPPAPAPLASAPERAAPEPPPAPAAPAPVAPPASRPAPEPQTVAVAVPAAPSGPTYVPLRFGLEPLFGLADADIQLEGPMGGAAATFGVGFDRHFGLDLRFSALGGPSARLQDPRLRDHVDVLGYPDPLLLTAGGGIRALAWSHEEHRLGWMFELVGSYAYLEGAPEGWDPSLGPAPRLGRHGGLLELAIGPQLGWRGGDGFATDLGLSVRFQQGLGDLAEYRAVLLGARLSLGADTPEPRSPRAAEAAAFQYTFGVQGAYGLTPGADGARGIEPWNSVARLGAHFGVPIGRWLELRARGGVGPRGVGEDRSMWILDVSGGARVRFDEVFPLYVEASAGYAFQYGATAAQAPAGALLDVGIGARFSDCSGQSDGALEVGLAARIGLENDRANDALFVVVGYEYAGGTPMFGANERWLCRALNGSGGGSRPAARGDEDPLDMGPERRMTRASPEVRTPNVEARPVEARTVEARPARPVQVEVRPPRPQTFEVVIGLALPGVELRLAPSALPLAALSAAGFVEVQIVGPAYALPRAEAELRAAFGARGARLDSVVRVVGGDPTVRARITVYPPGSR
jgi:hypothetical protein